MTPMLLDINGPEFVLLLVLAVILFGPERLPELARKAARVVRYVRTMAGTAQEQLSKELGPGFEDLDFRDLNPEGLRAEASAGRRRPDHRRRQDGDHRRRRARSRELVERRRPPPINGAKDRQPGGPHDADEPTPRRPA